jgi:uncharacterized Ntn-hydrolase superfamily protein
MALAEDLAGSFCVIAVKALGASGQLNTGNLAPLLGLTTNGAGNQRMAVHRVAVARIAAGQQDKACLRQVSGVKAAGSPRALGGDDCQSYHMMGQ